LPEGTLAVCLPRCPKIQEHYFTLDYGRSVSTNFRGVNNEDQAVGFDLIIAAADLVSVPKSIDGLKGKAGSLEAISKKPK
jgi:hypothetical protein